MSHGWRRKSAREWKRPEPGNKPRRKHGGWRWRPNGEPTKTNGRGKRRPRPSNEPTKSASARRQKPNGVLTKRNAEGERKPRPGSEPTRNAAARRQKPNCGQSRSRPSRRPSMLTASVRLTHFLPTIPKVATQPRLGHCALL